MNHINILVIFESKKQEGKVLNHSTAKLIQKQQYYHLYMYMVGCNINNCENILRISRMKANTGILNVILTTLLKFEIISEQKVVEKFKARFSTMSLFSAFILLFLIKEKYTYLYLTLVKLHNLYQQFDKWLFNYFHTITK